MNAELGLCIGHCNQTTIYNNNISLCNGGISLGAGFDNELISNILYFNNAGIMTQTNQLRIENNSCYNCSQGIFAGASPNVTIINNYVFNNTNDGICIYNGILNKVTNNSLITNGVGLRIFGEEHMGWDIFVTWNIFDKNSMNAVDEMPPLISLFDYNYWSDYVGTDENNDGIGDEKYSISGWANSNDTHPLFYRPAPPSWAQSLNDQIMEFGDEFSYNLNITTGIPVKQWWLEDTTYVQIDSKGIITNSTVIPVGSHEVDVWVENVYGLMTHGNFTIIVQDTTDPIFDEPPTDRLLDYKESLSYKINASDLSGIHHFTVNDTSRFSISQTGLLTNATLLAVGDYGLEIRAYDPYDNNASWIIVVRVFDVTIPEINSPEDIQYYEGETGFLINWTPTDDNPVNYEITLDGEVVKSGLWNSSGEMISISVDGHTPGEYTYGLRVFDIGGHDWYDEVVVTVLSTTTTTTTTPPSDDIVGFIITLSLIGSSGVVILLIVLHLRKRRGAKKP